MSKRKILFITDQQEYSENGTISTLFDQYLQEYFDVHIVYITKYKHSFQEKGHHYIVPIDKKDNIVEYLEAKGIDMSLFSVVFVRNKKEVLKNVLENKKRFAYKVAYRVSYPKRYHKLHQLNTASPIGFIKSMLYKKRIVKRDALANQCDLFLPPSIQLQERFFPNIRVESFPVFTGLAPDDLNEHRITDDKIRKFIFVGLLDEMREFHTVLDAFDSLKNENWHLTISTTNKDYINQLVKKYPNLITKISIVSAMSLKELRGQINEHDVGIATLPKNDFYDTVLADKVLDYYTCSIPVLLTSNVKNHSIFTDEEAIFSDFESSKIADKLDELINTSNEELSIIGNNGQKKLLRLERNYKILAEHLAEKLDEIIGK